jgi:hypothetical protein
MKSHDNFATEGLSGSYKQVVFRQRFGETILSKRPKKKRAGPSAAQMGINATFKKAVLYAKSVMADAVRKAAYQLNAKPGQTAFNRAVGDFFKPPVIEEINSSGYNGQVGGTVIATVMDDFRVASVQARIKKGDGTLIEEGEASLLPDGSRWMYVSTVQNNTVAGTSISFTATDLPGHSSTQTKTIS